MDYTLDIFELGARPLSDIIVVLMRSHHIILDLKVIRNH